MSIAGEYKSTVLVAAEPTDFRSFARHLFPMQVLLETIQSFIPPAPGGESARDLGIRLELELVITINQQFIDQPLWEMARQLFSYDEILARLSELKPTIDPQLVASKYQAASSAEQVVAEKQEEKGASATVVDRAVFEKIYKLAGSSLLLHLYRNVDWDRLAERPEKETALLKAVCLFDPGRVNDLVNIIVDHKITNSPNDTNYQRLLYIIENTPKLSHVRIRAGAKPISLLEWALSNSYHDFFFALLKNKQHYLPGDIITILKDLHKYIYSENQTKMITAILQSEVVLIYLNSTSEFFQFYTHITADPALTKLVVQKSPLLLLAISDQYKKTRNFAAILNLLKNPEMPFYLIKQSFEQFLANEKGEVAKLVAELKEDKNLIADFFPRSSKTGTIICYTLLLATIAGLEAGLGASGPKGMVDTDGPAPVVHPIAAVLLLLACYFLGDRIKSKYCTSQEQLRQAGKPLIDLEPHYLTEIAKFIQILPDRNIHEAITQLEQQQLTLDSAYQTRKQSAAATTPLLATSLSQWMNPTQATPSHTVGQEVNATATEQKQTEDESAQIKVVVHQSLVI